MRLSRLAPYWRIALWALGAAAALSLAAHGAALAQSQLRTVSGIAVNATPGGGAVAGQTVTLHRISADGFDDLTTTTDDGGAFAFDPFEYDPTIAYGVSVRYRGAIYGSDLDLASGSPPPVTLTVYEGTSDDSIVSSASASLLLADADGATQTLAALEIVRLVNSSNMAYVPGEGAMELLRFGLPQGATGLVMDTPLIGADFIQVDRGFALLASVPPGEHEVMFSYRFPYESERFTLEKTYRYGANELRILAPDEVVSISSSLGEAQPATIGERQYSIIEARGLTRGAAISVELGDLPTASVAQRVGGRFSGARFEFIAPAALATLMAGLLVYGAVWRRDRPKRAERSSRIDAPADSEADVIRRMIDDAADGYASGALSESDYRQRRKILDARLAELSQSGGGG